jgi:hypothetical protein
MAVTLIRPACDRTTGRAGRGSQREATRKRAQRRPGARLGTGAPGIYRLTNAHDDKEGGAEAAEVEDGAAGALDKVIGVGAARGDPVGDGGEDVGGDDEEGVVVVPEGAGEDDEEESDGEDEGEGDDGLEAGGRHGGRGRTMRCAGGEKVVVGVVSGVGPFGRMVARGRGRGVMRSGGRWLSTELGGASPRVVVRRIGACSEMVVVGGRTLDVVAEGSRRSSGRPTWTGNVVTLGWARLSRGELLRGVLWFSACGRRSVLCITCLEGPICEAGSRG